MTERRENTAQADTRWATAYEEWNAGPRELGTGRRAAFLAGWQAARQALIADAAIAADDRPISRVVAIAAHLDHVAVNHLDPLHEIAKSLRAAVGAPVTAGDPQP